MTRNAPLVVPPDFHLTPPVAGTAALSAGDAQQQAIETLFGPPAPRSDSETSLLEAAGRNQAQLGIRTVVSDPDTRMVDKGAATLDHHRRAGRRQPDRLGPTWSITPGQ